MPLFSVIVPFLNEAEVIAPALESIRTQTCADWEAIFVDDGSQDGTAQMVAAAAAAESRIRLIRHPGRGPSAARNAAAVVATGTYLSFCDADDIWAPGRLAELAAAFAQSDADGLYGQIGFFRQTPADSRTVSTVHDAPLTVPVLLAENPVCTMSNLTVGRHAFLAAGGLDTGVVHNEDLEFLVRFVGKGACIRSVDSLQVWYRASPTGLSSDLPAMRAGRENALRTARRFGFAPDPSAEAAYLRYLARRALRIDSGAFDPARFTLQGLRCSARGFLFPLRRGGMTALAAFAAPVMPRRTRHFLFSN